MAKAKLEYDLNDVDDKYAHKRAVKSLDMALALWDISNLRKKLKFHLEHDSDKQSFDKYEAVDFACDKIFEIFYDHKIDLDDLME